MRMLSFDEIAALGITPATCVKWARDAIVHKREWKCPKKTSIKFGTECFYTTMPAYWPSKDVFGVKVVSRIPDRVPALKADILLYASLAGELLAFMDGTWITAMRTGAVAAITADALKKEGAKTYGFIGLGNTARSTLLCMDAINGSEPLDVLLLRYKDQHDKFIERFASYKHIHFTVCDDVETVIGQSDVLFSCVTAKNHLFADEKCFAPGITVIPVQTRGFQNCDIVFDRIFCDDTVHIRDFQYYAQYKRVTEMTDVLSKQAVDRVREGYTPLTNACWHITWAYPCKTHILHGRYITSLSRRTERIESSGYRLSERIEWMVRYALTRYSLTTESYRCALAGGGGYSGEQLGGKCRHKYMGYTVGLPYTSNIGSITAISPASKKTSFAIWSLPRWGQPVNVASRRAA